MGPMGLMGLMGLMRPMGLIGLISLVGLMGLVSCEHGPGAEEEVTEKVVGFAAHFAEEEESVRATRAEGDPEPGDGELTNAMLQKLGFGVYCWYTGTILVDPTFPTPKTHIKDYMGTNGYMLMRNQKVEYDDVTSKWGYSPRKYWPQDPSERLTLRAYAPYTNYLVTDAHGMPLLPVTVKATDYANGTQHDPLWGTGGGVSITHNDDPYIPDDNTYGGHYNNYTYEMSGDRLVADTHDGIIHWFFHHGMSKLMFSVKVIEDSGCEKVTITGITITPLYNQGLLDLSSPTASSSEKPIWTNCDGGITVELEAKDLASNPFEIDTKTNTDLGPHNLLGKGLLIIPRNYTSPSMTVTLTYMIDNDPLTYQAEGTIARNFLGNTSYTLGLTLSPSTKGLDITLVQSAFTDWIQMEETERVYNW